jgi:hypothetical protein
VGTLELREFGAFDFELRKTAIHADQDLREKKRRVEITLTLLLGQELACPRREVSEATSEVGR